MNVCSRRFLFCVAAPLLFGLDHSFADYKDDIGYTALTNQYSGVPNGSLATVIQVEAIETLGATNYVPLASHPEFAGKTFTTNSGPSTASSHATEVGWYFYGKFTSVAPGISNVWNFEAEDWVVNVLQIGTAAGPLQPVGFRVINHSWAGDFAPAQSNLAYQSVRRTDAMIDLYDITTVAGVPNGGGIAQLLGSAYNVIAVSRSSGAASGPTSFDTSGRVKPDIVAPLGFTSYATPVVSAAAVLLTDSAILQGKTNALKPVVVKSLMMTGAEKLVGWNKGAASTNDDHTVPTDYSQGAGELQIDRSYTILQEPEAIVGGFDDEIGWDFGSITTTTTNFYYFNVGLGDFTATLNWNRHVPTFNTGQDSSLLNNLDLYLFDYSGFVLGPAADYSISSIDNVEHLYLTNFTAGTYALGIVGTQITGSETYGISWWGAVALAIPEPSAALYCVGFFLLIRQWVFRSRSDTH